MKKKILFLALLITSMYVNAQNFTLNELVNIFKTQNLEEVQEFLVKEGLTFILVQNVDELTDIILYGGDVTYNNRAKFFVEIHYNKKSSKPLTTIKVQFKSVEEYKKWFDTVKNTYKAELQGKRTYTTSNSSGIVSVYNGKTLAYSFFEERFFDEKAGGYKTSYQISFSEVIEVFGEKASLEHWNLMD